MRCSLQASAGRNGAYALSLPAARHAANPTGVLGSGRKAADFRRKPFEGSASKASALRPVPREAPVAVPGRAAAAIMRGGQP